MQQVVKGIFANWHVCLGVFMATGESDLVGKMVGAWFPVSAFVMIGVRALDCRPLPPCRSAAAGADATVMDTITKNIIPVTIGNIIAGAVASAAATRGPVGALGGFLTRDTRPAAEGRGRLQRRGHHLLERAAHVMEWCSGRPSAIN